MSYKPNQDLVNGNELLLYVYESSAYTSGSPIAFATSVEISTEAETIDTNNKMSCRWQTNLQGNASYSISSESLYTQTVGHTSFDALMAKMAAGVPVYVEVGTAKPFTPAEGQTCEDNPYEIDTDKPRYRGVTYITSLSLSASTNEVASCSCTLTGSGELKAVAK